MSKNKKILIKRLFSHLEGIVAIPTFLTLQKNEVIQTIKLQGHLSLNSLITQDTIKPGYLNVALTTLASLNLLKKNTKNDNVEYTLTEYGLEYINLIENYSFYNQIQNLFHDFIINDIKENDILLYIKSLNHLLLDYEPKLKKLFNSKNQIKKKIAYHIEGVVLTPLLIYNDHNDSNQNVKDMIKKILSYESEVKIDEAFNYFSSKAKSYGVTASYQPIFSNLDEIIFKGQNLINTRDSKNNELHVNRRLNVWGSGGAHKTYFNKINEIIIDIFNEPIKNQPLGIADMGCGDGMFLHHIYKIILEKTLRGKNINRYPLKLIGADLNQKAIDESRKTLNKANIDCDFLIADISNPDTYKNDLKNLFNIDITELLHMRSFLDHNRIYKHVEPQKNLPNIESTGAYAHRGEYLDSSSILANLIHHFTLWKKHVTKHGLLLLELHGLNIELIQNNNSSTPTVAYEATHGYSDQYIVEYNCFLECANASGLKQIEKYSKEFPDKEIITISINLFR